MALGTDAVAKVAQVVLAGDMGLETGEVAVTTPLVRLLEVTAEVGIVDVLIDFGSHFQDDQAGRIVAGAASGAIVRRTDRAGEAQVNGGADKPTEAAVDVALRRQQDGTRCERIVREPAGRGLGERHRKGVTVMLVESLSVGHKGVKVKGRELLVGKRENAPAHSGSSFWKIG